ncbi:MAG: DNA polymerase III subunit delta [Gemmatimonadetes bacterium]|nr:DNA polymerase III subunit delta [Gemmatimonadota bacterium]
MPGLVYDAARRELGRNNLAPVYYLTGSEEILKDELVAAIVNAALDPQDRDFNLDIRTAGDLDGESLHALVETVPMLAERRVVVIRGLEQWRKGAKVWEVLGRYLRSPSATTVLVLLHATEEPDAEILSASTHVVLEPLSGDDLHRWARAHVAAAGVRLEPAALAHLLRAVGDDLAHVQAEIEKLAGAIGDDRPVTVDDVAQFVGVRHGETLEDWVTAVLQRDVVRAVRLVDLVLPQPGITGVRMITALGTELVGVRLARALADHGLSGRRLEQALLAELRQARPPGARSWADLASSWTAAISRWTGADLDYAIEAALETDTALKSTTVSDEGGLLRGFILGLRGQDRAA